MHAGAAAFVGLAAELVLCCPRESFSPKQHPPTTTALQNARHARHGQTTRGGPCLHWWHTPRVARILYRAIPATPSPSDGSFHPHPPPTHTPSLRHHGKHMETASRARSRVFVAHLSLRTSSLTCGSSVEADVASQPSRDATYFLSHATTHTMQRQNNTTNSSGML